MPFLWIDSKLVHGPRVGTLLWPLKHNPSTLAATGDPNKQTKTTKNTHISGSLALRPKTPALDKKRANSLCRLARWKSADQNFHSVLQLTNAPLITLTAPH